MKDKSPFRLILIGFLSGILFSGMILLTINLSNNHQLQESVVVITPIAVIKLEQSPQISTNRLIDLNQATLNELVLLPGIGEAKANAIIDFRNKYGAFEAISELSYVPGIGNTLLKSIQDLVIIN